MNRSRKRPFSVLGVGLSHDASAALLVNGDIHRAVEEERLNRMKHWNFAPVNAMRWCLAEGRTGLDQLDAIAIAGSEPRLDLKLRDRTVEQRAPHHASFRHYFADLLERHLGSATRAKLRFYDHHLSHAFSAYATAGFEDALLVALDGAGDGFSGGAYSIRGNRVEQLASIDPQHSLGHLYENVTRYLGYKKFDEYKVMGLAPYGRPARFRRAFRAGISLEEDGTYRLEPRDIMAAVARTLPPGKGGANLTQPYRDLAAALQEAFEEVALHFFAGLQRRSGQRSLAYAGGVAHNCAFNGKLLRAGLFDDVYVQPAADDSGLAVGAACLATIEAGKWSPKKRSDVFLGPSVGPRAKIAKELAEWADCLDVERTQDTERRVAVMLARGDVVGWVQGPCEFGPRALGNRSILADPRPAGNKGRINAMIKKREGYRPFAPSVLREALEEFFVVDGPGQDFPTMSVVLPVRPRHRRTLGAITHVDGTARVQTVQREDTPRFWRLIDAFGRLTGVPMLLNTSFNNHREPIVCSVHDALACFLTTGLDALVVDDFLVTKRRKDLDWLGSYFVATSPQTTLARDRQGMWSRARYRSLSDQTLSRGLFTLLLDADGSRTVGDVSAQANVEMTDGLRKELFELWSERHVEISPRPLRSRLRWPDAFDVQWL